MNRPDPRGEQALALAGQLSTQMYRRFGREVPLDEIKSLAQPAAVSAAAQWDGRGSFPRYVIQRTRWAVLDGLRREQRHRRVLDSSALHRMAALSLERAGDVVAFVDEDSADPPPAADALIAFFRGAAANFTLELDAAGALAVPDPSEDVESNVERMRVRRAVEMLPEPERSVIERHDYAGETFDEIAEAGGMPRATVFSLYVRAQEKLRRVFEDAA